MNTDVLRRETQAGTLVRFNYPDTGSNEPMDDALERIADHRHTALPAAKPKNEDLPGAATSRASFASTMAGYMSSRR